MSALDSHVDGCGCQWCRRRRSVDCMLAGKDNHPDHRVSDCPAAWKPTVGDEARCSTCGQPITYKRVEEYGYLPRIGWSDGCRADELVCFKAIDYRHEPAAWPLAETVGS